MKARMVVSLGAVVGFVALPAAALVSMADAMPASAVSERGVAFRSVMVQEGMTAPEAEDAFFVEPFPVTKPTEALNYPESSGETQREEEAYLLAKIAMAEAEGEDTKGKALVMLVVLNRVKDEEFPDTIEDVIYQPGQFNPIASGRFDRVEPDDDCWQALSMIESDGWDESMGATYFESKSESVWHKENLRFLFKYGSHYFYMDKGEGDE